MAVKLKDIRRQVVVITGASSGIGLTTARMASRSGAKVVLAARNEEALRNLADEIHAGGGEALAVPTDVSREADVRNLAEQAVNRFGGFDTWVNDAGVSIYGRLWDVPLVEQRRLFETNYWGVVHGSLVALEHLRRKGGAVINLGSIVSDRAIPLQGAYVASKHAIKGFTDTLRMEIEAARLPVSVTLIKPGSIDTPFPHHARNHLDAEPKLPPPVYAPETVARAILHCCATAERELTVGGGGKAIAAAGRIAPRLTDLLMENTMFSAQKTDRPPAGDGADNLFRPGRDLEQRGGHPGYVFKTSAYTEAMMHPILTGAAVLGAAGLAVAALWRAGRR